MKAGKWCSVVLYLLCLGLASCGGGGGSKGLFEFRGDPDRFTLRVLPESGLGGELAGEFSLQRHDEGDEVVLDVLAEDASALKAFYFEVEYNPNQYSPISAERSTVLGHVGVLELAITDIPGRLSHGQILANPERHPGFSGSGSLASLRFARHPLQEYRQAAKAPLDAASQNEPGFDSLSGELSWLYRNTGDYDQNGVVTISDLTPLGIHFGESNSGGFPDSSALSVIDGDKNGLITISDITPIGVGFDSSVSGGYNIYRSGDVADYPSDPKAANGGGAELLGNAPLSGALGDRTRDRLTLSFTVEDPQTPGFYWLRPVDAGGSEGYCSTLVSPPDGSLPVLSVPIPPAVGNGTAASPYEIEAEATLQFKLVDKDGNDVTEDPLSSYSVDPDEAAGFTPLTGNMTVNIDASGVFNVSASYDGLSAAQVIRFRVADSGPVAVLSASKQFGPIPLNVTFNGADSTSPGGDGFIVEYSFDWEDDGSFDESGASGGKSHTFTETGLYSVRLRVRDNKDRTAETTVFVDAYQPGGPNASLSAAPLSGREPLNVGFDASGSTPKNGNPIDHFEFDFNNDFDFSDAVSSNGIVGHSFETPGVIPARIKVLDDDGLYSIAERRITVNVNNPPVPDLQINQQPPYYAPANLTFDASGSTDSDGGIVGYSFDFDGDGSFEYEGTEPVQTYEYTLPGNYGMTLMLTDSGGKTAMLGVDIMVFEDDRPVAVLEADVLDGLNPLTVNFDATGSMDPQNAILAYEWDFNGDGDFSDLVEQSGVVQHDFISPGTFNVGMRVRDADDNTDTAYLEIKVTQNKAPNADVRADKLSGFTPITIEFDGSHSTDADGSIVMYEWDVDNDMDFVDGYGNDPVIDVDYIDEGGSFPIWLRVTDDKGAQSTDSVVVNITNNETPVADLQASALSGFRPLTVQFDGSASFDPDGTITKYRWDFDHVDGPGNEFELEGLEDQPSYVFDTAGDFSVYLEVVDNGGKIGSTEIPIHIDDNEDPSADLQASAVTFSLLDLDPITFDGSASFDLDPGDTILCDYDFDGDGVYDSVNKGKDETQIYSGWTFPGMYLATLRVHDNHGASGYATWPITVTDGQAAPSVTLNAPVFNGEAPFAVYFDADGTDSNGVIETYEFDYDGPLNGWTWEQSGKADKASALYTKVGIYTAWVRATDDDGGVALGSHDVVVEDRYQLVVLDPGAASSDWMDAAMVDGRPAVAYASGSSQLRFVIADNATGSSWEPPQIVNSDKCTRVNLIELQNGRAGISYYSSSEGLKFTRAADSGNSSWTTPVVVEASADNKSNDMVLLFGGNPAVVYFVGSVLKFKRALDPNGDLPSSWPVAAVTIDTSAQEPLDLELINVFPAIVYKNGYTMCADQLGTNWPDLYVTGVTGGTSYSLVDRGNVPRFIHDYLAFDLAGSDDGGASWPFEETIINSSAAGKYNSLKYINSQYFALNSRTFNAGNYTVPIARMALLSHCINADGTNWDEPYAIESLNEQGTGMCTVDLGGQPGMAYRGTHNGNARILKWQVAWQ